MRHLKTILAVIGAAAVLVLAANTVAMAATGQAFLLGKTNFAGAVTTVERTTNGPAFKITNNNTSSAPLVTNGTGKVTNLNADKVDGIDSTAMQNLSYVWRSSFTDRTVASFTVPLANGSYLISYSSFLQGADVGGIDCFVKETNGVNDRFTARVALNNDHTGSTLYPAVSGTGLVTKSTGTVIKVECHSTTNFHTWDNEPFEIVATKTTRIGPSNIVTAKQLPKLATGQH